MTMRSTHVRTDGNGMLKRKREKSAKRRKRLTNPCSKSIMNSGTKNPKNANLTSTIKKAKSVCSTRVAMSGSWRTQQTE